MMFAVMAEGPALGQVWPRVREDGDRKRLSANARRMRSCLFGNLGCNSDLEAGEDLRYTKPNSKWGKT
jgi:hypothetical protein